MTGSDHFDKIEIEPTAQVETRLDALRQQLLKSNVTVIRGVAYPR